MADPRAESTPGVDFDAVIVGAGFAGLCMLQRLRELGLSVRLFEAGDGVGGTWFWNRYPGARCDVPSLEYSYQFSEELQQEWEWTERYASQPEILRYLNHVADRFDLRRDIQLETRVEAAHFDAAVGLWRIRTSRGSVAARFCIMATGCLSSTSRPDFPGLDAFEGDHHHTGDWPQAPVDFGAKRVAVIGTGSSGIQCIPLIAAQAAHVYVFQRTASYSVPAQNGPLDPAHQSDIKSRYAEVRARQRKELFAFDVGLNPAHALETTPEERDHEYQARWKVGGLTFLGSFSDLLYVREANHTAAEFIRGKIREIVRNPEVAQSLSPRHLAGCKRLCVDTGYYETFNRSNVTLVDLRNAPIEEITANGIRTGGREFAVDLIVFATGFDAMTGSLLRIDIRGSGGVKLRDKWADGPRTYLGLGTAGFPNFFVIAGPGSPSVLTNMVVCIEQHVGWIADCIAYMGEQGFEQIDPDPAAEDAWVAHANALAEETLYPEENSWYLGANIPGKPRIFMPYLGFPPYEAKCDAVAANDYEGFRFRYASST